MTEQTEQNSFRREELIKEITYGEAFAEPVKEAFRADLEDVISGLENGDMPEYPMDILFMEEELGEWKGTKAQIQFLGEMFLEALGIDLENLKDSDLVRENIEVEGVEGQPSKGGGIANVYKTQKEGVYLRVVDYPQAEIKRHYDLTSDPDLEL